MNSVGTPRFHRHLGHSTTSCLEVHTAGHWFVQLRQQAVTTGWYIKVSKPSSRRYLLRPLERDYPCSSGGILDEETLGIYGELHLDVAAGVAPGRNAQRPPDALGPNRHGETGSSTTYFDGNSYHLGLLSSL